MPMRTVISIPIAVARIASRPLATPASAIASAAGTTLAASLVDFRTGETLSTASSLNPRRTVAQSFKDLKRAVRA